MKNKAVFLPRPANSEVYKFSERCTFELARISFSGGDISWKNISSGRSDATWRITKSNMATTGTALHVGGERNTGQSVRTQNGKELPVL